MTPSPLWTKREAARFLAVSTSTLDRLVAKRHLPFVLIGGRRRFREADVLSFVASRSFGHRSDLSSPASIR